MTEQDMHEESQGTGFSRRQAIKGVVGAGAVVWTVPAMQVISMTAAHADSPSVPGNPSTPPQNPSTPPQNSTPPTATTPPASTPPASTPPAASPTASATNSPATSPTDTGVEGTKVGRTVPRVTTEVIPANAATLPHTGMSDATVKAGIAGAAAVGLGAAIMRATRAPSDDTES